MSGTLQFCNSRIQWVVFDAVGTLIEPMPRVAEVYHAACVRHGGTQSREAIATRFREVMSARIQDPQTNEEREREFWQRTVAEVIGTVDQPDACFAELYDHFARPESWAVCPGVAHTLSELTRSGVGIAVASNFDERLHGVLDGSPGMEAIRLRIISSEIGWRKPDRRFFDALLDRTGVSPKEILIVGDDVANDIVPARELGMSTVLIRESKADADIDTDLSVTSVDEILAWCQFNE